MLIMIDYLNKCIFKFSMLGNVEFLYFHLNYGIIKLMFHNLHS